MILPKNLQNKGKCCSLKNRHQIIWFILITSIQTITTQKLEVNQTKTKKVGLQEFKNDDISKKNAT